jgi:MerR family transcriptional regulator/heat shock protein HspR
MPDDNRPVYTIGTAAELLNVHPRTLRLYEQGGLLKPARRNNRRFYTNNDLRWIKCIRYLIHERGLNQEGLRRLLALIPCWEIKGCPLEDSSKCPAYFNRSAPCWEVVNSVRYYNGERKCYRCEVYLSARGFICSDEELEVIENYEI